MSAEHIQIWREGRVFCMQMNRPEKKNALTRAMYTQMTEGLVEARQDPEIRAVLLQGHDTCFTAGNDVLDFMQDPPTDQNSPVYKFLQEIIAFPKPVVAVVQGVAIGIGTTMLLHCDLVYASEQAVFGMPFVSLGLCPEAGSSFLLPRILGHVRASELLLLGEKFDSHVAYQFGLINKICPQQEAVAFAMNQAKKFEHLPPASVRLTKSLLKQAYRESLAQVLEKEGQHFIERLGSEEATEAFSAFVERRTPDFSSFS